MQGTVNTLTKIRLRQPKFLWLAQVQYSEGGALIMKHAITKGTDYQRGELPPIKNNWKFCVIHYSNFLWIWRLHKMEISIKIYWWLFAAMWTGAIDDILIKYLLLNYSSQKPSSVNPGEASNNASVILYSHQNNLTISFWNKYKQFFNIR